MNTTDDFRELMLLHAPALADVLDDLDAGITPDWLAVLTAISQGVNYFTDVIPQTGCRLDPGEIPPVSYCPTC